MNLKFIEIVSLCLSPAFMSAQTEMTVNPATSATEAWGTERTERYDVAFRLLDTSLCGSKITQIRIPFADNNAISGLSVWISGELSLADGENAPDISFTPTLSDGYLSATLPDPLTLSDEECFIGFSFTVNELNDEAKTPVTVSPAPQAGDMYVHTSRRYRKWGTQNLALVPSMEITLSGNFHPNSVAVLSMPEAGGLRDNAITTTVTFRNHGLEQVSSIDYMIATDRVEKDCRLDFDPPLPADYFADHSFEVELDSDMQAGSYPVTIRVNKVNGTDNQTSNSSLASMLFIYPYLPERIPLMEEYTGTWCGWCPRGIVGMERMTEAYPEKFVYAAYHRDKDPMNTVDELATPYAGAPSGYLDRVMAVDPYNGLSETYVASAIEGIGKAWNERRNAVTTGQISAMATWTDESHRAISVKSSTLFVRDYDSPRFKIAYLLVADGLHGDGVEWVQSNYFSGDKAYADMDLIEFVNRPDHITDMVYDGVVVMSSPLTGVDGSLPENIAMEVPMTHHFEFIPDDATNYLGDTLPIDKERLRVIACIVDSISGEIVNCAQSDVYDEAAIGMTPADDIVISKSGRSVIVTNNGAFMSASLATLSGITVCHAEGNSEISLTAPANGIYILNANGKCVKIAI